MNVAVAGPLIAAVVTAVGWLVAHVLQQRRDFTKRMQEAESEYIQRQIEELYGPLSNLATQIVVTNHVLYEFLRSSPEEVVRVEEVFYFEYFRPLHQKARELLKSKLHLVEGSGLPETFYAYLKASMQEEIQRGLWKEHKIDTSKVKGQLYPDSFTFEVQETLKMLLAKYDSLLHGLHSPSRKSLKSTGTSAFNSELPGV